MSAAPVQLLHDPDRVRLALSPIRRQLLDLLREPASATQLAAGLGLSRQRVNYHLRALEQAGLVELVEIRRRRGCVERILVAGADAYVVDPAVMANAEPVSQDRYAAEHLIDTAGGIVRDVARMRAAAERSDTRLLTFTIETEVGLAEPNDVHALADALAAAVARVAADFETTSDTARRYRFVLGGHPAPRPDTGRAEP